MHRSLQRNALEGSLPPALSGASALRVLQLDDNRLNGSLHLHTLPGAVREVGLRGNALTGGVPAGLDRAAPDLRWGGGGRASWQRSLAGTVVF